MFQFPGLPWYTYGFSIPCIDITLCGFSHSDIHESLPACGSSWLFAAYRVLLRLLVPRHPPYALIRLTFFYIISDADLFIYPQLNNANLFNWALKYFYFLFTHISSLVKKLSVQFARLKLFYLLQKNSSIIHCAVFKEPFEFTFFLQKAPSKLNSWTSTHSPNVRCFCSYCCSLERRWSSRTFRYGYLVTTSPQSLIPPSTAPS